MVKRPASSKIRAVELENRLITFGVQVCDIAEKLPKTQFGIHVAGQIIRSSTAPAPNYGEAQSAESRKDFIYKMKVCLKELRESQVWLKFILAKNDKNRSEVNALISESHELISIFVKSIETAKKNLTNR